MASQSERRAVTRGLLVAAAEELFVRDGYDATPTQAILDRAGLSRGALYHHFDSKESLFGAVFEQVSRRTIENAARRMARSTSASERLIDGCLAWLEEARQPGVAPILLELGPRVLGWQRARDLEARFSLGAMTASLQAAVDAGEIWVPSVKLYARLLNAVLAEAALVSIEESGADLSLLAESSVRHLIESWRVE